ncbi:hypothetical protein BJX99DRAFT_264956, partial [Aspergillus californicus]
KAALGGLIDEDSGSSSNSITSDPIKDLVGTTENPGPLHYMHHPQIYIISPAKYAGGPLLYGKRAQWLAGQLHAYLNPDGSAGHNQKPTGTINPYAIVAKYRAESVTDLAGKAMMEFRRWIIGKWGMGTDPVPVARWRLWVGGKEAASWEFVQ